MSIEKVTIEQIVDAYQSLGSARKAASYLGVNAAGLQRRLNAYFKSEGNKIQPQTKAYEIPPLPEDDIPIEQLIAHRKRQFEHKRNHEEASKLIPVKINIKGPIGIWLAGDPHVDDDGTDLAALQAHSELVNRTEGMFAANVGDTTNNWVGRLARLYGEQSTSAAQAWRIAEWFITGQKKWLWIIGGNHDAWSGSGDPIKWITKQQGTLYKSSEARLALNFPNGLSVRINSRHDHSGSSIWNPAHGPMKAAIMGTRDHLFVAGHQHTSAYSQLKDPIAGIVMHTLRVSSYKTYDRYAKERGFRDNTFSPCAVAVINSNLPETHPDMLKIFWDAFEGADYLTYLRKKK